MKATRDSRPEVERRTFESAIGIETRAGDSVEVIRGHSAVFNSLSQDLGWFREIIRPGAFAKSIGSDDVRALFNHDPNLVLARTTNGTLSLREDVRGLYMEAQPSDTSYGRDLVQLIKRGDINQQSFGFTTVTDAWRMEGGEEVRELLEVKLWDVSPVTYPAYTATDVGMRGLFQEAGLDWQGASRAFVRQFRGLELTSADRDILGQASRLLAEASQTEAGGQEPPASESAQSQPSQAWRFAHLRRRLELTAGI